MNPEALARQFHSDGYVIARGIFTRGEIDGMERHLVDLIRNVVPKMGPGDVYYEDAPEKPIKSLFRLEEHSAFFKELMDDARLLRVVGSVFPQAEIVRTGVAYFGKAARSGSVTPAHQDNGYHNLRPPEGLICTIAIDESTPENGALTVQKGSHLLGTLPHRPSGTLGFSQTLVEPVDPLKYPEVQLCLQPGDICLHHTNVIHRSGPNTTARSRRQLGIGYRSSRAKRDEAGNARYQTEVKKLHATAAQGTS